MPIALSATDAVLAIAVGIGLSAAAGLRVFLPMLVLGGAGRLGWIPLGTDFTWLASDVGLVTLLVATVIEVVAYSIPTVDNAMDIVAGPAAVVAGIVAIAAVTSDLPAPLRWSLAVIAGGGTAGIVQSVTTLGRLKSTGLTGGLANPFLALAELAGAAMLALLSVAAPLIAVGVIVVVAVLAYRLSRRFARRTPLRT